MNEATSERLGISSGVLVGRSENSGRHYWLHIRSGLHVSGLHIGSGLNVGRLHIGGGLYIRGRLHICGLHICGLHVARLDVLSGRLDISCWLHIGCWLNIGSWLHV